MKIVIDARFFGTETGIGRYVKELVENLENIDNVNNYVIFLRKENFDLYQPKNKNFIKKLADIKWYGLKEQLFFGKMIDGEKADLCHFPHFNVPLFCKTPYVMTVHDLILRHFPTSRASTLGPIKFWIKYFFYNFILAVSVKRARKIITPTYFVRNELIKVFKINPDKISVISEGPSALPDKDLGGDYLKQKGIGKYILYVGNAYPHKNLERLAAAFEILKKEDPDLQLVLVGKRDYFSKRLEEYISTNYRLQATNYIFYDYASDEELVTLYKHASLYVFPSLMEGFGLPPLEALSFGLPSAVSDIPVFHEVLGEAAFYFNPREANDIARIIKDGLNNNEKRVKVLEEGKRLSARYGWQKSAAKTLEIYSSFAL